MVYLTCNMLTKEYWENRAKTYGHTGFSDPFLYCFDQEARKFAIGKVLSELELNNPDNALDFGCGTGDFFEVLLKYSHNVTGYDISDNVIAIAAAKFNNSDKIEVSANVNTIKIRDFFDLVISITVLQKLDKEELKTNIATIATAMKSGAYMICLESFIPGNETDASAEDWQQSTAEHGLYIRKQYSFYNPDLFPSTSWEKYKQHFLVLLLKPFKRYTFAKNIFSTIAKQIINREKDVLQPINDIFKIYVLQKL